VDRKAFTIFLILFTEVLGATLVIPIMPFIGLELGLDELEIGLIMAIFSFCQLFASPIIGKLSDKHGRRPLLLFSQCSTFIGFILLGFAHSVWVLVLARVVDGIFGSNMTVAQACLSDITPPAQRTHIYTVSSGVFGAGLIFGPLIASLLSTISVYLPMFVAAGVSLFSLGMVILYVPETNQHRQATRVFSLREILPIGDLKTYFKRPGTGAVLLAFFCYDLAFALFINNSTLFAQVRYGVGPAAVGYFRTYIGTLRVLLQAFIVRRIILRFGEDRVLWSGILGLLLSMALAIFSPTFLILFIPFTLLAYGSGIGRPILTSKLTTSVNEDEYATVLGIDNALKSFTQVVSPIIGGLIFLYAEPWVIPLMSAVIFGVNLLTLKKVPAARPEPEEQQRT
jgi:DHA1 family tetracycline resistance protein-like MFS transporter